MNAQLSNVWRTTLPLDTTKEPLYKIHEDYPTKISTLAYGKNEINSLVNELTSHNNTFLYSKRLKQSIIDSRKAFLSFSYDDEPVEQCKEEKNVPNEEPVVDKAKPVTKRISFKVKKTSSVYRKNTSGLNQKTTTTLNASTVKELTAKFNQMVSENNSILEEPQFKKFVKRVNSLKSIDSESEKSSKPKSTKPKESLIKVIRKPSVKTKPNLDKLVIVKRRALLNKNAGQTHQNSEQKLSAKIETNAIDMSLQRVTQRPTTLQLSQPMKTEDISPSTGSVRATIEIFEKIKSDSNPNTPITAPRSPKLWPNDSKPRNTQTTNITQETSHITQQTTNMTPETTNITQETTNIADHSSNFSNITNVSKEHKDETILDFENVQILNIPLTLPQRRCESMYETMNLKKVKQHPCSKSQEVISQSKLDMEDTSVPKDATMIQPNTSFLWSRSSLNAYEGLNSNDGLGSYEGINPYELLNSYEGLHSVERVLEKKMSQDEVDDTYEIIEPPPESVRSTEATSCTTEIPSRVSVHLRPPTPPLKSFSNVPEEKIYEELKGVKQNYDSQPELEVEKSDDGYEYCGSPHDNIYETLPPPKIPQPPKTFQSHSIKRQGDPLPPRPVSVSSTSTLLSGDLISNCYESIYSADSVRTKNDTDLENNYESLYSCKIGGSGSNRDSLVSSDQQTNSIYGRSLTGWDGDNVYNGKATSDLSSSDKSDEWVDMSDNEENFRSPSGLIIIRERLKTKKTSGWSQHWSKSQKSTVDQGVDVDSDSHHYESLYRSNEEIREDDYDSFDSDTDSENSFTEVHLHDSGVDVGSSQLPEPPNSQYVLTRLAARAGKHMRKFTKNLTLTKNDITKSLSKMTRRKSKSDVSFNEKNDERWNKKQSISSPLEAAESKFAIYENTTLSNQTYQNCNNFDQMDDNEKSKSLTKGFLNKFRRSISMTPDLATEVTSNLASKPKSTFYLTEVIDVDGHNDVDGNINSVDEPQEVVVENSEYLSQVQRTSKINIVRPQSPPPPTPSLTDLNKVTKDKRSTSWYAEVGLFKNSEMFQNLTKRPNTCWYAEVGLYKGATSTPSSSSAENSGTNTNANIRIKKSRESIINQDEEYYNLKNESGYYNDSVNSFSSIETKKDLSINSIGADMDIQLRLQDEPLYQFYDAAVLESVCQENSSDFDSDNYEEILNKRRPSAMEIVAPKRNSWAFSRTLWCEIPEVLQSTVLSTLSLHQKKIQEAKFEIITSEASYLNSLNVLTDHFLKNLKNSDTITDLDHDLLFSRVAAVKDSSNKLLLELEKCWQENILLHGVCDIVQKHAEENFSAYISYCENQIFIDVTLKTLKDHPVFNEYLRQLEASPICQSLSLYSFLMLPMQRITRWPLLIDAVLKRLSPQDTEYATCQLAFATISKIVNQCNEAARTKEQEADLKKAASQLEFSKSVRPIEIVIADRYLLKSGSVIHVQTRSDEIKLTFGKRLNKVPLHLFLFNDLLIVAKPKSDNLYSVLHYCSRSLLELSSTDLLVSVPTKDAAGKHLLFLTLLENQDEKTIEFLLSCSSETDKERWIEALSPPKSDNPEETLYECWDCPQVTAIHTYSASQPDELALSKGDVINVLRKMADGWNHGERIRDGQTGWFPANYTKEIANPHVRARNLKQRYRLLAISENYLKSK